MLVVLRLGELTLQPILQTAPPAQQSLKFPQTAPRNVAMDAYRGFVMLLMMAEVLQLARVARNFPGNCVLGCAGVQPEPRALGRMFAARH